VKPRILQVVTPPKVRFSRPGAEHGGRSFPSSHTFNNFAVATVLALFYRRGAWWFLVAGFIGWSRVYTGSHWPSDVLISAMLGCGLALILMSLFDWLWRKYGATRWPALPSLIFSRKP
jgi:undecaprenyl-diphosphatase